MRVRRDEFALQEDTFSDQEKCSLCTRFLGVEHAWKRKASPCVTCDDAPDWRIDLFSADSP
jgi:hypothetical protein